MKPPFAIFLALVLLFCGSAAANSSPAEMISEFRLKHCEPHVTADATLNRIALEQAKAMAAKDRLDHEVLRSFSSRITPARSGRAAENIAYGYDSFKKRSINGLRRGNIEKISCSTTHLASASPAQRAPSLTAHIGQWRLRANTSRCRPRPARMRRPRQNENRLCNLAA